MTYVDATSEMLVRLQNADVAISIPYAGAAGRFATWSPGGFDAIGERDAPFAEYWQPAHGPAQIVFDLGDGERACEKAK